MLQANGIWIQERTLSSANQKGPFFNGHRQNDLAWASIVTLTPPNTITTGSTSFPAGGCTELAMIRDCTSYRWPTFSYALKTVNKIQQQQQSIMRKDKLQYYIPTISKGYSRWVAKKKNGKKNCQIVLF